MTRAWSFGEPIEVLRSAIEREAIIAIPTESSYGLAVSPWSRNAVERLYAMKQRQRDHPLPVVAASLAQVETLCGSIHDPMLRRLARQWPAPLSLLVPIEADIPAAAGSGRLAIRVPADEPLCGLLQELGTPLTATSANRSGERPLLHPEAVAELLADEDAVLVDGGILAGGNPSTLVGVVEGELEVLRRGAVPIEAIVAALEPRSESRFSAGSAEILVDDSH